MASGIFIYLFVKLSEVSDALKFTQLLKSPEQALGSINEFISNLSESKQKQLDSLSELKEQTSSEDFTSKKIKQICKSISSKKEVLINIKQSVSDNSELIDNALSAIEHGTGRSILPSIFISATTIIPAIWLIYLAI